MGRQRVAAGVDRGNSSPSSAESSFRELDDSFLQTQTRIWLEEVLDTRLDEDLHVSDLLQDGEILFELSKVVWNLLLTKCPELRYLKGRYGPFGSKKSSGRYRPYSNVDSFLKICKIMGLKGIDLFSPSDAVEKRDIRKVCICVRAFSKKARSKQLSVPDFDMVMYSVPMPKDMVGCIRRSLELPQSVSSSSSSPKDPRSKLRQENLHTPSDRDDDSCSEESEDAESRYMGENSFPNPSKFDNAEVNSVLENNHQFNKISSFGVLSRKKPFLCGRNVAIDVVDSNFTSETSDSVVGDSSCISGDESSYYIADYLAFSDSMVHATDDRNLAFLDGENKMFDFFLNPDSQGKISDTISPHNGYRSKFSDDDETEVSSTSSMTSVLCRVLNLELDYQYDTEHEFDKQYQEPLASSESKKSGTFAASLQFGLFDSLETQSEAALSAESCPSQNACQELDKEFLEVESFGSCTKSEEVISCTDNSGLVDTEASLIYKNEDIVTVNECKQEKDEDIPAEKYLKERSNASHGISPWKLSGKPLLKAVFKGTAIVGVFFLLMQINGRTSGGDNALATKEYARAQSKFPSKKTQISWVNGIYPAERIKL